MKKPLVQKGLHGCRWTKTSWQEWLKGIYRAFKGAKTPQETGHKREDNLTPHGSFTLSS